jgi:hypothetical protein
MVKIVWVATLSSLFLGSLGLAQELPIYDNNANRIDIYHFQKYLGNNDGIEQQNSIGSLPTAVFKYQSDTLSTQMINQAHSNPNYFEDYSFSIELPEMPFAQDTLIMMVAVPSSDSSIEDYIINVAIVENQGTQLAYHFDLNNDYSFSDEGAPYIFKSDKTLKEVRIKRVKDDQARSYYVYDLAIMPAFLARYGIKVGKKSFVNSFYYPILNRYSRISLQFAASFGKGNHSIAYATPALARELTASMDAMSQLAVSATYSLFNVSLGGFFLIEGSQIGQTERYTYEGGIRYIDYGFGKWPRRRIAYGLTASYDLRVYKNINVAPVFRYGTYRYISEDAFVSKIGSNLNDELTHNEVFQDRRMYSIGGQVKFPLGEKALLLLEGNWINNQYQIHPDFILEPLESQSLVTDYKSLTFGVGVQWLIFARQ